MVEISESDQNGQIEDLQDQVIQLKASITKINQDKQNEIDQLNKQLDPVKIDN